jgi:hypothetical protein
MAGRGRGGVRKGVYCLGNTLELEQRVAAIDHGIDISGVERDCAFEGRERVRGTVEAHQGVAALEHRIGLCGIEGDRPFGRSKRGVMTSRAIEDQGMVHQKIHPDGIEFERRRGQRQRLFDRTLLVLQHAQEMQRLDMIGRELQDTRIESLGLIENAAPVQLDRAAQRSASATASRSCVVSAVLCMVCPRGEAALSVVQRPILRVVAGPPSLPG